jgi:hypothetical protein
VVKHGAPLSQVIAGVYTQNVSLPKATAIAFGWLKIYFFRLNKLKEKGKHKNQ